MNKFSSKNPSSEPSGYSGEQLAQQRFGTTARAGHFYDNQVVGELNGLMREFVGRQEMCWIATADQEGNCDSSFRAGPPGFVVVLDARTLAYPEYRGNGVMASVGNVLKNPRIGLLFLDMFESTVGLHVNGKARVVDNEEIAAMPEIPQEMREAAHLKGGRHPECWVIVKIEEAYIHCSKHVPRVKKIDKQLHWGSDDDRHKGGNFFQVKLK